MTIKPWLDKAGAYKIAKIPCPNFASQHVDLLAPRTGVLHTTEGGWESSMSVFRVHYAPHFIVGVNAQHRAAERFGVPHPAQPTSAAQIAQLVPLGVIGAACKAHNDHAVAQIEMVGYAQEKLWLPEAGTLDALASLMLTLRDECGIPLWHPWKDGDFGRASDNPHRHAPFYGRTAGWFGHGDMPSPDSHWDPGALAWSKVFAHAHDLEAKKRSITAPPAVA